MCPSYLGAEANKPKHTWSPFYHAPPTSRPAGPRPRSTLSYSASFSPFVKDLELAGASWEYNISAYHIKYSEREIPNQLHKLLATYTCPLNNLDRGREHEELLRLLRGPRTYGPIIRGCCASRVPSHAPAHLEREHR